MVDRCNVPAHLWTLREACSDLVRQPLVSVETFESVQGSLHLAREALREPRARGKAPGDEPQDSRRARSGDKLADDKAPPSASTERLSRVGVDRASLEQELRASEERAAGWIEQPAGPRVLAAALAELRAEIAEVRARLGSALDGTHAG